MREQQNYDEGEPAKTDQKSPHNEENKGECLMYFLSIDQLANRSKIVKSTTLLGNPGPFQDVPLEPHWSKFEEVYIVNFNKLILNLILEAKRFEA